jgi:predicted N-formylglutamate amidohydrolase
MIFHNLTPHCSRGRPACCTAIAAGTPAPSTWPRRSPLACTPPLYAATTSRLLVDLNRSRHHRSLFSAVSASLSRAQREDVLQRHYRPYREAVEAAIGSRIAAGRTVLHLSVHSFAPILDGLQRDADIGLLYDPARAQESGFCRAWQHGLRRACPAWRIRRNFPYRGRADGFTTHLRKRFSGDRYLGVELEINQRQPLDRPDAWPAFCQLIADSLGAVLGRTDERGQQP